MRKLFISVVLSVMLASGVAFATDYQSQTINGGNLDVDALSLGGGISHDVEGIPNGAGFAVGAGGGISKGDASGFVKNGTATGMVRTWAGGTTASDVYRTNGIGIGDKNIGIVSYSDADAQTGGQLQVSVDPTQRGLFNSYGAVGGKLGGVAAQGTLNGTALTESPKYFSNSEGFTGGVAGQASVGGFVTTAGAVSGPDFSYRKYIFCGPRINVDSNARAGNRDDVSINMAGLSATESYRFVSWDNGAKTEGMGTFVDASTVVSANGHAGSQDNGLGYATSNIDGGFVAAGFGATKTVQHTDSGLASANANGAYFGAAGLNNNYTGSISGATHTGATQYKGRNGSYMNSKATMTVSSEMNGQPQ